MQRNDNLQLEFVYNPLGQRILKIEKPVSGGSVVAQDEEVSWKYTYYAYDANSLSRRVYDVGRQVMSIYELTNNPVADIKVAVVEEQMLYGASRLGQVKAERTVYTNQSSLMPEGNFYDNITGKKRYELTNHLGNVNAVITDRKVVSGGYVVNTFTSSTESWLGCTNASVSQSGGKLQVSGSGGSDNCAYKVFTVTPNVTYTLQIKSKPGTGVSSLDVKVYDGMTMLLQEDLADDVFTTVNFTCTGSAATIIVDPSSSGNYSVDEVVLTSSSIYEAVVLMEADYYPFGMEMPARTYNGGDYRYAYNGMEVDPETKGNGNSYTTEFRQYDPRLGRWLSLDPLMMEFPWQSPYCAFDNNPVVYTDPYGLSATNKDGNGGDVGNTKYSSGNSQGGEFCSTCGESNQSTSQFDLKLSQTIHNNPSVESPPNGNYFAKVKRVEKVYYRQPSFGTTVNGTLFDQQYQREFRSYANYSTGTVTIDLNNSGTTPVTLNVVSITGTVIFNGVIAPGTNSGNITLPNAEIHVEGGTPENYEGRYNVTITKDPAALPTDTWLLTVNKLEQVIRHRITYYLFGWIPISRHSYKEVRTLSGTAIFAGDPPKKNVHFFRIGKEARRARRP